MSNSDNRRFFFGFILVAIGALILINNLDVFDIGYFFSTFWPLIFIIWGISFLLKTKEYPEEPELIPVTNAGPIHTEDKQTKQKIQPQRINKLIGDIVLRLDGEKLKSGSYSTLIGEIFLDLSAIDQPKEPVKLYLNVTIGSVRLLLNPKISYKVRSTTLIGDVNIFNEKDSGFQAQIEWENNLAGNNVEIIVNALIGDIIAW